MSLELSSIFHIAATVTATVSLAGGYHQIQIQRLVESSSQSDGSTSSGGAEPSAG